MKSHWIIKYGDEYMRMDEVGLVSRPAIGMKKPSGDWRVTGAVVRNNFGYVVCRLTLHDLKTRCDEIKWQHKNGKQRVFITDLDHGTHREWQSPKHWMTHVIEGGA